MTEDERFIDHQPITASQQVEHEPEQNRFVLRDESDEVVVEYELGPGRKVNFSRTYTPERLRGRGLARVVADRALAWARLNDLRIDASCSYIQHLLQRRAQSDA